MDIILIPGLWLDASSWDAVTPALEQRGHRPRPLTLPGMGAPDTDRSDVTLQDHIDAVVAALDDADGPVAIVAHSAGGGLAHAAVDARPGRVSRVVYVGGEPRGTDEGGGGWPAEGSDVPLPDWSFFDDEMVADLDDGLRATIRDGAIPSPLRAVTDPQQLSDDRRYDVPATVITTDYPSEQLKQWAAEGAPGAEELGKLHDVEYVDLLGGHWPQFSKPDRLAEIILASLEPA